ncbi:MAG: hypothetical protein IPL84_03600 [Chitinophagaceae bacterium]|nr:hypothetical protein [Chitinophagaceae bacterium]
MKKDNNKNTAVIIFSFISFAALAQKNDQNQKLMNLTKILSRIKHRHQLRRYRSLPRLKQ